MWPRFPWLFFEHCHYRVSVWIRVRFPRRGFVSIYRWHFLFQRGGPCSRSKQAYDGEDYLRMYFNANTDASASAVRSSDAEVVRVWALRSQKKFYVYAFIFRVYTTAGDGIYGS